QKLKADDWGNFNLHDGGRVVQAAGSGVSAPIGPFASRVITTSENTVERTDAESCPPACPITVLVVAPLSSEMISRRFKWSNFIRFCTCQPDTGYRTGEDQSGGSGTILQPAGRWPGRPNV